MESYWNEEWKNLVVEGTADNERFKISNYGRIKSYKVDKENGVFVNGSMIDGYNTLTLRRKNGKTTTRYVHKLVAQLFIQKNSDEQIYVIHCDFNKRNNHHLNLKWATKKEKEEHQNRNPNFVAVKGKITYSKLSETQVIRIKKMLKRNNTRLKMIAKQFGITHTQLNRIRSGENWGHVVVD